MANPVAHHDNHPDATHCCCAALQALACAATKIHDQYCCCSEEGCTVGCACCCASLGHVLDAMEAHIKCLRGTCVPKYAAAAKGKTP